MGMIRTDACEPVKEPGVNDVLRTHTSHFNDIRFSVVATVYSHRVEFKAYEILSTGEDMPAGRDAPMLWHKAGSPTRPDPVESLAEAELYLSGEVKWDGCSNWRFDEQDRVQLHFCGRKQMAAIGELLARLHDLAAILGGFNFED
jgi:hypothetical protein